MPRGNRDFFCSVSIFGSEEAELSRYYAGISGTLYLYSNVHYLKQVLLKSIYVFQSHHIYAHES